MNALIDRAQIDRAQRTMRGQLYIVDFAVWLMIMSTVFVLIADTFENRLETAERTALLQESLVRLSNVLLTPPISTGTDHPIEPGGDELSNIAKLGIVRDERFDPALARRFLSSCKNEHETTRAMLGLFHSKANMDYNIQITYLNGTVFGDCAVDSCHGLRMNRYVLDEDNNVVVVTVEVCNVD